MSDEAQEKPKMSPQARKAMEASFKERREVYEKLAKL